MIVRMDTEDGYVGWEEAIASKRLLEKMMGALKLALGYYSDTIHKPH